MIRNVIKYLFYFLSYFYVYRKLLNLKPLLINEKVSASIFSISFSLCMHFLILYIPSLRFIILTLSFFVYIQTHSNFKASLNFIASIITIALSNIFYLISLVLTALLMAPVYYGSYDLPLVPTQFCIGTLQYLLLHLLFYFPRLRKGMPFLYQPHTTNVGLFFSIITLICITIAGIPNTSNYIFVSFPIFILVPTACIFAYWWLHKITQNYLAKLHKTEIASLELELKEKDTIIARIEEENQRLAAIIHRDNKLIPSMEAAIYDFLKAGNKYFPKELKVLGLTLARELQSMSRSRQTDLSVSYTPEYSGPSTRLPTVDILLSFFYKHAIQQKITYTVTVENDLNDMTVCSIRVDDLTHILADLIENAMIAVRECTTKHVYIHFTLMEKYYVIEISDSGPYFDTGTLNDFGLKHHTTHKETGGSGIGLMDIWKIKEKYQASLSILEIPPGKESITKKISLIFDHKNLFILQTFRADEVQPSLFRNDLVVMNATDEKEFNQEAPLR